MSINKIRVNILGREYVIKSGENPEYAQKIACHVSNRIEEVARRFQGLNREQIIVLAAMNMADDYFQLEEMIEQDKEQRGDF